MDSSEETLLSIPIVIVNMVPMIAMDVHPCVSQSCRKLKQVHPEVAITTDSNHGPHHVFLETDGAIELRNEIREKRLIEHNKLENVHLHKYLIDVNEDFVLPLIIVTLLEHLLLDNLFFKIHVKLIPCLQLSLGIISHTSPLRESIGVLFPNQFPILPTRSLHNFH